MDITSLGLHITDRCNAKCLHCAFACGPDFRGSIRLEEAKHYVVDAKALDAEIVCITGGEPMLYPNLVKKIISECSRLSFPEVWLFTNGFWTHDMSKARATVEKLRSLGLTKMFTSIDFFHQRYIPIESVKNMIEASLESSLEVCVDARFIGQPDEENEFNSATRSHLEFLGDFLSKVEVTKAQPMFVGRAGESLAKQVKMESLSEILNDRCPGAWAGGTLESPLGVDVDNLGFVTICPGLSIGNTRQASFRKIVEKYDYQNYAVIAALYNDGVKGLMNLASEKGFVPKKPMSVDATSAMKPESFSETFSQTLLRYQLKKQLTTMFSATTFKLRRKLRFMEKIIKFAVKINQRYKYLILISIALGGFFPQLGALRSFLPYLIAVMTGASVFTCSWKDLDGVLRKPSSLFLGLAFMFGVAPLLSYMLSASLVSTSIDIAAGLILVASTPSPWAVGVWTGLGGGDVALALSLLVSSMVLSVFLTPLLMALFVGTYIKLDFLRMSTDLVFMVILPIVFVACVKSRVKKNLEHFNPVFFSVSSIAAIIIGAIVGATVFPLLWRQETVVFLPILTLVTAIQCLLSFSVSYFAFSKLLKRSLGQSIALTYSVGSRNNSIAMGIALTYFSPLAATPSIIYLITQIIASSAMLKILERKNRQS